jgi:uncharacterized protein (DUF433 family)
LKTGAADNHVRGGHGKAVSPAQTIGKTGYRYDRAKDSWQGGDIWYDFAMNPKPATMWKLLAPNPKSAYKQLFLKNRRIRARDLYGMYMNAGEPMTPAEIAADYDLPLEAVEEAIAYCQTDPPEIKEDFEREERIMEATGMNDPAYKYGGKYRILSPKERARLGI